MRNKLDSLFLTRLFVPQASQISFYRRAESEIRLAIPSTQKCVCGMEVKMEEQKITIRRLTPELCKDWITFFDDIAFQDHGDWAFCYCLEGHLDRKTQEEWTNPEERREKAIQLINDGTMQGYLAYMGREIVGWCNVNDRGNYRYLTEMFHEIGYTPEESDNVKVKTIFCFLIAPEYRGRGIAQGLLGRVCEDAAKEGYTAVEAYPFADKGFEYQYHGTYSMYQRNGFLEAADLQYVKVMRKTLRQ